MQFSQIIIGGFGIHTEGQYESNGTIPARLPLLVEGTEAGRGWARIDNIFLIGQVV
jgi:hypothetical protein